jgi:hypothetical protein
MALTAAYFFESGLFKGLRAKKIRKMFLLLGLARRVVVSKLFKQPRPLLARLTSQARRFR